MELMICPHRNVTGRVWWPIALLLSILHFPRLPSALLFQRLRRVSRLFTSPGLS